MIITVTPTPAIDVTYTVEDLPVGAQIRSQTVLKEASGKAINVSAALAQQGFATHAIVAVSSDAVGDAWLNLALAYTFPVDSVPVTAGTRLNTTIKDASGTTTRVNEPVAPFTDDDVRAIVARVEEVLSDTSAEWVVCSGSLPPDNAERLLADLARVAHAAGAKLAVDSSGAGLSCAVQVGVDLLKPNDEELRALVDRPLRTVPDIEAATADLARSSHATVLTTLGGEGAVASDGTRTVRVPSETITVANTAGAGDATLAGFLAASLSSPDVLVRASEAVQWGAAACRHGGTVGLLPEAARHLIANEGN